MQGRVQKTSPPVYKKLTISKLKLSHLVQTGGGGAQYQRKLPY